ncbi:signal peptidase I [Leifsonia sp. AG29]|uniref:signal peptidase I n=1 Tax=Leifsonia sp. AG29 TaxID=2598860 RepID=UPI00131B29E8|nr:signal peptidase I [Leifsonia sp. AG29]
MSDDTAGQRPARSFLHYLGIGLSAGLLGLVLFVAAVAIVIPRAAGATPVTVLTTSMEPTLPPGTLIVIRPKPLSDIHVGDVMTYQIRSGDPAVISHRVVAITSSTTNGLTFTTKGDNNARADAPVVPAQVRGVVWYSVPLIGYVNSALDPSQRSWLLPAAGVLLLLYAGWVFVRGAAASIARRRRRSEASGSDGRTAADAAGLSGSGRSAS